MLPGDFFEIFLGWRVLRNLSVYADFCFAIIYCKHASLLFICKCISVQTSLRTGKNFTVHGSCDPFIHSYSQFFFPMQPIIEKSCFGHECESWPLNERRQLRDSFHSTKKLFLRLSLHIHTKIEIRKFRHLLLLNGFGFAQKKSQSHSKHLV